MMCEGRTMQEQLSRTASGTAAEMQEVEQRMEQLPRMPEPRVMHGFEHGNSYFAEPRDG